MKQKLVMMKGLPGCGKTTEALILVKEGYKRVNKDDLRAMIDSSKWSKDNEYYIKEIETELAVKYLEQGFNVVVDDTNFSYETHWEIVADKAGADFEIKFFDVPVMECIKRDSKRGEKSVGSKVIMGMYERYLKPQPIPYNPALPDCYLCDIDGTVALMKNRSPFEWKEVGRDIENEDVTRVIRSLKKDVNIIFLSGRDSVCRAETEEWLIKYDLKHIALFMRPEGDNRKDTVIKKELYENHILGNYNVLGVFDDRDQVVGLWRSLSLTCFQVAYGDF